MRIVVVVDPLDGLVGEVELVLDVADDLLEEVLERHDAGGGAVLVDDDRHVLVRPPELAEQSAEILRLRHDVRRAEELLDRDGGDGVVVERRDEARTWRMPRMSSSDSRKTG